MTASDPQTLKSSEKLFAVVDALLELGEAGVTELAAEVPFHKSTVYVHLQTMREHGLVAKSGDAYRLSLQFLTISEAVRNQRDVYRQGKAAVDRLAADTGELALLGVPEHGAVVVAHEARGEKATQNIGVGSRVPIAETAMGKAMLAAVADGDDPPDDDAFGDAPAAVDGDLADELEAIRRDGYVVSEDELGEEMPYIAEPDRGRPRSESHRADVRNRTVAAPVHHADEPVGVVTVTGPAKRISDDYLDDVRRQVVNAAELIERKLRVDGA